VVPKDSDLLPAVPPAVKIEKPIVDEPKHIVKQTLTVVMTAYSSTRAQTDNDPFTTASGEKVRDGIVAMNQVPFGTKIRIPDKFGDKIFVVKDRMSARYGKSRGDIWMKTYQQAKQWGVKRVKVEILK
jgi:3D (Asp-Asp-Asp) domain-containing protein